jgi:hypothetical protein
LSFELFPRLLGEFVYAPWSFLDNPFISGDWINLVRYIDCISSPLFIQLRIRALSMARDDITTRQVMQHALLIVHSLLLRYLNLYVAVFFFSVKC